MAAYLLARTRVTDPQAYGRYTAATGKLLEKFGGRLKAATNAFEVLEGKEEREFVVIIEFDSREAARATISVASISRLAVSRQQYIINQ